MNHLNSHLQTVANQKDSLVGRLQQPYVGDFIKMDVHSKQYVLFYFILFYFFFFVEKIAC